MTDNPGHYAWTSLDREFVTKDSGQREEFDSGAKRDTQTGKPRYDLIPAGPLKRLAELMARGAEKYDDNNWTKGMPASRFLASLMRHIEAYRLGDREEDHLAGVVFNAFALMYFESTEWDDINGAEPSTADWPNEEPESSLDQLRGKRGHW